MQLQMEFDFELQLKLKLYFESNINVNQGEVGGKLMRDSHKQYPKFEMPIIHIMKIALRQIALLINLLSQGLQDGKTFGHSNATLLYSKL